MSPPLHGPGGGLTLGSPRSDVGRGTSDQELVSRFQAQNLEANKTTRPGVGTHGNLVNILANLFKIRFPKGIVLYDYVIRSSHMFLPRKSSAVRPERQLVLVYCIEGALPIRPRHFAR